VRTKTATCNNSQASELRDDGFVVWYWAKWTLMTLKLLLEYKGWVVSLMTCIGWL